MTRVPNSENVLILNFVNYGGFSMQRRKCHLFIIIITQQLFRVPKFGPCGRGYWAAKPVAACISRY
jgi:hypothetical protein